MRSARQEKSLRSGVLALLILLSFSGIFEQLYQLTPLPKWESQSASYLADVRERATYAYAAARSLNAVISVLESIDIGLGFVSAQPAQVLAPLDDMIEQFSDLILMALACVGIQEILIAILGDISWTYLLPLALLPLLLAPWLVPWQPRLERLGILLLFFVLGSRLLIPTISLGGSAISETYLKNDYQMAVQRVEQASTKTSQTISKVPRVSQDLPPQISTPSSSVFSKPKESKHEAVLIPDWDMVKDIAGDYEALFVMLGDIPARIITLMTIFAFETIALPLLMVFLAIWFSRVAISLLSKP